MSAAPENDSEVALPEHAAELVAPLQPRGGPEGRRRAAGAGRARAVSLNIHRIPVTVIILSVPCIVDLDESGPSRL